MNIKLIDKYLYFNKYKIKCSVGKRGITPQKIEGDNKTPAGIFKFNSIFYRKDRIPKIVTGLKKIIIKKNMGWCDDSSSKFYNKLIKFPFNKSAERLWLKKKIYDIIIIINYNLKPVIKNKGSAIFIHLAKKNYSPTRGCIAISKRNIVLLISILKKKTKLTIY